MNDGNTQEFVFESDSIDDVKRVLDVILPILFDKPQAPYKIQPFLTRKIIAYDNGSTWLNLPGLEFGNPIGYSDPLYVHLCTIGDFSDYIKPGDQTFDDPADISHVVIGLLQNADRKLWGNCVPPMENYDDDQPDYTFNHGYRLEQATTTQATLLNVSLCYIVNR